MNIKSLKGFSLIEVLVFVAILSVFFIVAASVATVSLRNMKVNEHKIIATHYGEELLSDLRSEKEVDWNSFVIYSGTYCFNNPLTSGWDGTSLPCDYSLSNFYKREALLNNVGNQINIKITVAWQELGNTYSVPLSTVFTVWE